MQQTAIVLETAKEIAVVCIEQKDACANCHATCVGCRKTLQAKAKNLVDAKVGDTVLLESHTGRILGIAACVFVLPLLLGGGILLSGSRFSLSLLAVRLSAVGVGLLSFVLSAFGWNRVLQKKPDLQIIQIIESHQAENGVIDG